MEKRKKKIPLSQRLSSRFGASLEAEMAEMEARSSGDGASDVVVIVTPPPRLEAGGGSCSKKSHSEREFEDVIDAVVKEEHPPTPLAAPAPLLRSRSMHIGLAAAARRRSMTPSPPRRKDSDTESQPDTARSSAAPPLHRVGSSRRLSRAEEASVDFDNLGYLMGPGGGSLIGRDELAAVLPDGHCRVAVGTWNVAGLRPDDPTALATWLRPDSLKEEADIYAIGIQEGPSFDSNFWTEWEELIGHCLGRRFFRFYTSRLGVLVLSLFVRRSLVWFLTVPGHANVMINPANPIKYYAKTKGAVAVAFNLFKTSFLFINSHLSYGAKNELRIENYRKIVSGLRFHRYPMDLRTGAKSVRASPSSGDITASFDRVFWFGDLNFGTDGRRSVVERLALNPLRHFSGTRDFGQLLLKDKLTKEIHNNRIFCGFAEADIRFPPTYKYDIGTSIFDTSAKNRVPAYTDRVLFRSEGPTETLLYTSACQLSLSDHKPVFAAFKIPVRPGGSLRKSAEHLPPIVELGKDTAGAKGGSNPPAAKERSRKSTVCAIA